MLTKTENKMQIMLALEDNMSAKFAFLPNLTGGMEVVNDGMIINSNCKSDMFNIVCKSTTSDMATLENTIDIFKQQKISFSWWTGFHHEPPNLIEQLKKLNLIHTENELGMFISLSNLPNKDIYSELIIKPVLDINKINDFASVIMQLVPNDAQAIRDFYEKTSVHILENQDKLKLFIGYINNNPVSTSAIFCHAGVAGVWDIITLPEARRKGVGTDMTLKALTEGKKLGYDIGVLTASDEGKFVYENLGFKALQQFHIYNLK